MRLTIGLATRGRPELLRETVRRTLYNVREPATRLVVLCDEDDPAEPWRSVADLPVVSSVAPREDSLGGKFNRAMKIAPAEIYLIQVDYAPFVTPGFDRLVLEAASVFPDGIGVVYNHMANLSFPSLNAVTARWAALAGGIYPEIFPYWFVDHWLDDLARLTDRFVAARVEVDVERRPGTMERREPGFWADVYDALVLERRKTAGQILDALDEPEWRKALLRSRMHLVDERSILLNDRVRTMPDGDRSRDGRYLRIRRAALDRVRQARAETAAFLKERAA